MLKATAFALACIMPPPVASDTPEWRLAWYYVHPKSELCYRWDPHPKLLGLRRAIVEAARASD